MSKYFSLCKVNPLKYQTLGGRSKISFMVCVYFLNKLFSSLKGKKKKKIKTIFQHFLWLKNRRKLSRRDALGRNSFKFKLLTIFSQIHEYENAQIWLSPWSTLIRQNLKVYLLKMQSKRPQNLNVSLLFKTRKFVS